MEIWVKPKHAHIYELAASALRQQMIIFFRGVTAFKSLGLFDWTQYYLAVRF